MPYSHCASNLQDAIEALDLVARGKVHGSTIPCKLEDLNQCALSSALSFDAILSRFRTYDDMLEGKLVGRAMVRY